MVVRWYSIDTKRVGGATLAVIGGAGRLARNVASILTSDVMNRATTFILYALVARHLGALEFGQLSLALSLSYTFQVIAVAGLKTLVIREVARDRAKTDAYLVNASVVVVVTSLVSIGLLLVFVSALKYAADTASIVLLLSLGLLPYALSAICEAVFQAWEQMQYIAYANVAVNVAKLTLAYLLLARGFGLNQLVILMLGSYAAVAVIEWWIMRRHVTKPRLRVDPRFALAMTKATGTFLGIDGIIAIMSTVTIVFLSKLSGEVAVGLFSAATQVVVPVTIILQGVVMGVFPLMCRQFDPTFRSLKRISESLIVLLLVFALPTVIGLSFLADSALLLMYGERGFLAASVTLRLLVWTIPLTALTSVLGQVLVASLRERVTLRIVAIDALVVTVGGFFLISQFGLIGAASTILLTKVVDFLQHHVPVSRLLSRLALERLLWKPLVASLCMAAALALMRDQKIVLSMVTAGTVYLVVLLALTARSGGGLRQFKAPFRYLWSE